MRMVIHFQQCLDISACFTFLYKTQNHVCCVTDSCLLCLRLVFTLLQTCLLCLRLVFAVSQTGSFKKARFNRLKESETFETKICELWITKLLVKKGSIKKASFNRLKERRRHSKLKKKCVSCEQLSYLLKKAVLQRPVSIVSKKVRHLKHETVETSFFRLDRLTLGYSLRRLKQIILGLSKFTPWWNMVLCLNTNFDQIWKNRVHTEHRGSDKQKIKNNIRTWASLKLLKK